MAPARGATPSLQLSEAIALNKKKRTPRVLPELALQATQRLDTVYGLVLQNQETLKRIMRDVGALTERLKHLGVSIPAQGRTMAALVETVDKHRHRMTGNTHKVDHCIDRQNEIRRQLDLIIAAVRKLEVSRGTAATT